MKYGKYSLENTFDLKFKKWEDKKYWNFESSQIIIGLNIGLITSTKDVQVSDIIVWIKFNIQALSFCNKFK